MTHQMKILSSEGDTLLATWDPADTETTEQAETKFAEFARTHLMYRQGEGAAAVQMTQFDPLEEQILVSKNIQGG